MFKKFKAWYNGIFEEVVLSSFSEDGEEDDLSVIDIKAAIAKQSISPADLFSPDDLAASESVISLVTASTTKTRKEMASKNVLLSEENKKLRSYKDKSQMTTYVQKSPALVDKDQKTVQFVEKLLNMGKGISFDVSLTEEQRQEQVDDLIKESLTNINDFTTKGGKTPKNPNKPVYDNKEDDPEFYKDPENNPLIPDNAKDK